MFFKYHEKTVRINTHKLPVFDQKKYDIQKMFTNEQAKLIFG